MSKPETPSRTGEALSPAEDLRTPIGGFVQDFMTFSTGIHATLQRQEDRMNKLDRKSILAQRPALARAATEEAPHQKAFAAYLRSGDDDALRGVEVESKGMTTAVAADGGYLVDPTDRRDDQVHPVVDRVVAGRGQCRDGRCDLFRRAGRSCRYRCGLGHRNRVPCPRPTAP